MKPKDMTLGELVCEFVHVNIRARFNTPDRELFKEAWSLHLEVLTRFNKMEMSIPVKFEWGIPEDKANLIKNKKSYAEEIKKKDQGSLNAPW